MSTFVSCVYLYNVNVKLIKFSYPRVERGCTIFGWQETPNQTKGLLLTKPFHDEIAINFATIEKAQPENVEIKNINDFSLSSKQRY